MKNDILLTKNQEYVPPKCEKSYFLTKYRISAQNRIRPSIRSCALILFRYEMRFFYIFEKQLLIFS